MRLNDFPFLRLARTCGRIAVLVLVSADLCLLNGCGSTTSNSSEPASSSASDMSTGSAIGFGSTTSSAEYRTPVLRSAIRILATLDRFDQQVALDQVIDRLNQWVHLQKVDVDWKPDPFMDSTLPKRYSEMPWVAQLPDEMFNHELDGDFLKESAWLRDIAGTNRGDKLDDLSMATNLFDWTVRNIQLVAPGGARKGQLDITPLILGSHLPAEILTLGYGTAQQRAWIFLLLARQQGLDVVMLATPDSDHPNQPRLWLPALVRANGDKEELYLFDPALGLPIPGPGGKGVATLKQAIDDPSVLGHLDLDESHHYPVKSAEAKQAIALVEASPGYLSKRMKQLESQLTGSDRIVLTTSPSETVARLKKVPELKSEPRLWTWPYEVLNLRLAAAQAPKQVQEQVRSIFVMEQAPFLLPRHHGDLPVAEPGAQEEALVNLMKEGDTVMAPGEGKLSEKETKEQREQRRAARTKRPIEVNFPLTVGRLLQFRHEYGGEQGAKHFYMECRPGDNELKGWVNELIDDFTEPNQKPPVARYTAAMLRRKQNATYWLGLISFDEHEYSTAEEYLKNLTLDVWPNDKDPWADGAHYNLGRTCEAAGRVPDALALYEADESPQRHGNHLRARWLREATAAPKPATPSKSK